MTTPEQLARAAGHLTPEDMTVKMETRQYWPDHEAPDYGGLNGRFGKLLADRNARATKYERALHAALIVTGAVAGIAAAVWVAM